MNGETPFFKTAMGRDFFDRNIPLLVKELQKLNENLEALTITMKESKIDYAKVAQAIMDSPIKLSTPEATRGTVK